MGDEYMISPHMCKSNYCKICRPKNLLRRRKQLFNTFVGDRWRMLDLTFKDHKKDKTEQFIEAHKMLKKTIQRLRRKYGNFKYARVFEVHKSGFPHVHMVLNSFIPKDFVENAWKDCGGGHISIHEQKCKICGSSLPCVKHGQKKMISSKNAARYLTDELEKKVQDPHRLGLEYWLANVKSIQTSRNLKLAKSPPTDWMFIRTATDLQDAMYEYERMMYDHLYGTATRPSYNFGKNKIMIGSGYDESPDVAFKFGRQDPGDPF